MESVNRLRFPGRVDPLTNNPYDAEHRNYIQKHGLSSEEAHSVMMGRSQSERDAFVNHITQSRYI